MSQPITPEELNTRGVVWFGAGVSVVELRLTDGRIQRMELAIAGGEDEEPADLTDMQRDVLQAVNETKSADVVSHDEIAARAGVSNSGAMREFVKQLAAFGRLKKAHRGWQRV